VTSKKLAKLKAAAEKATLGPWGFDFPSKIEKRFSLAGAVEHVQFDFDDVDHDQVLADAAFIASCSPEVILSLVAEVERLRTMKARITDTYQALLRVEMQTFGGATILHAGRCAHEMNELRKACAEAER
jgi:hypothetical protein